MIIKLLTEHHLEFLSLKGGCRGSSESTLVKMSHCWKSHALTHIILTLQECAEKVKNHLPDQDFKAMIYMLRKFLGFMNLTVSIALN